MHGSASKLYRMSQSDSLVVQETVGSIPVWRKQMPSVPVGDFGEFSDDGESET